MPSSRVVSSFFAIALACIVPTLFAAEPQVLFSVQRTTDGPAIEPIVMVTKTRGPCAGCWKVSFAAPPRGETNGGSAAEASAFAARYYRPGQTYRVLSGGFEAGVVTVEKEASLGCISLAARVRVASSLASLSASSPWYGPSALAVGSLHVVPRKEGSREPTIAEEQALIGLAEQFFRDKGVSPTSFGEMTRGNFVSVDLNRDGKSDLISSYEVRDEKKRIAHRLFLIALAGGGGGYETQYTSYLPFDETDEGRTETVQVVDTIDLDEDGVDEVIISNDGYESLDYQIVKRGRNGKWTMVYRGGGSGC